MLTMATCVGLILGAIQDYIPSSPTTAAEHANITSPSLLFNFSANPLAIAQFTTEASTADNVDLGSLVHLFQVVLADPNFTSAITSSVDTGPAVCFRYLSSLSELAYF